MNTEKTGTQVVSELIGTIIAVGLMGWAASYLSQRVYPLGWWDASLLILVVHFCFGGKKS